MNPDQDHAQLLKDTSSLVVLFNRWDQVRFALIASLFVALLLALLGYAIYTGPRGGEVAVRLASKWVWAIAVATPLIFAIVGCVVLAAPLAASQIRALCAFRWNEAGQRKLHTLRSRKKLRAMHAIGIHRAHERLLKRLARIQAHADQRQEHSAAMRSFQQAARGLQ